MTEENKGMNDATDPLFAQLVMMFSSAALQHMGMAPGPGGEAGTVDVRSAEAMIDLLEMIERKTKGNLEAGETKMLAESLAAIRMAFVQATSAQKGGEPPPASADGKKPEPPSGQAPADDGNVKSADPSPRDGDEEPRFHKTYG